MPLCQVNIDGDRPEDAEAARHALRRALGEADPDAAVIVMIHGFKHSPWSPLNDPHSHILSLAPRACRKAVSWPGLLGLDPARREGRAGPEPVCIALGWHARGTIWQAYQRAADAGRGLAEVVATIHELRPGARVRVLAHSLGARVALSALPALPEGAIGRAALLAPAEFGGRAAAALDSPGGRRLEVLNVTSRENLVFDALLGLAVGPHLRGDRPLGAASLPGRGRHPEDGRARWLDLRIDDPATRAGLERLGVRVAAPDRVFCHWSVYLRAGLFDLYRAMLCDGVGLAHLRAALSDGTSTPEVAPAPHDVPPAMPFPVPSARPLASALAEPLGTPEASPIPAPLWTRLPGAVSGAASGVLARIGPDAWRGKGAA